MRVILGAALLLLAACTDRPSAPLVPNATSSGEIRKVYIGSTRAFSDGTYGIERSETLDLGHVLVRMPPNRAAGQISYGARRPNPNRDFTLAKLARFETPASFRKALNQDVKLATAQQHRDVTIFVHGFNSTFSEAAFRMAQMATDTDLRGPVISYSWPSRGNFLGYEYDADSTLFARDGLADLLHEVKASGAQKIVLIGHSMGARLVMEVLRQMEIGDPGWSARNLGGVLLMSPDIAIDVFRSQAAHFDTWPEPFIIFKSRQDQLLQISARLRGEEERLGNISDVTRVRDFPILFIDVTSFEDGDPGNHFVAGSSPEFLRLVRTARQMDREFVTGGTSRTADIFGGARMIGETVTVAPVAGER